MLRWVALVLVVLLVALQVQLWTGHGGLRDLWRLQRGIVEQQHDNEALRKRNDTLAAEVEDLKHGSEAVEERARAELGLLKPGETFIQVVEPRAADKTAPRSDER